MITEIEKTNISAALREYCAQKGSQNKAANSLDGVSSATISKMLAGDWELINEVMWRSVAAQIGYAKKSWNIVETRNYRALQTIFADAQENSLVFAVCGEAGCGKTVSADSYAGSHRNVYVLSCSEFWNRKLFMQELLKAMGRNPQGDTVGEMMQTIISDLKRSEFPLIIIDEADKLSDQVMYFFITLYNSLEDHCGIILMATDHLEKKIRRGLRLNKKGYKEIFSRIGRRFITLKDASVPDIVDICAANGVTDSKTVKMILDDCDGDFRRVKRKVHAVLKSKSANSNNE